MVKRVSELTKLAWRLGALATLVEIGLGFSYIFSEIPGDRNFGMLTMLEGAFAFSALLLIDPIHGKELKLKPDRFKEKDPNRGIHMVIILVGLMGIQIATQLPLTVRDYQRAAAIVFSGPAEELFFRGLLISIFIRMASDSNLKRYKVGKQEITLIEPLGFIISSMFFAMVHVNYYNNTRVMVAIFASGMFLAFAYWYTRDLTACIVAHLLLNSFTVLPLIYQVFF